MAAIKERRNRKGQIIGWQVQIRRRGYPAKVRTFDKWTDAEAWATTTEADMIRRVHVDRSLSERMTLGQAITDYIDKIVPTHKGGGIEEVRLKRFMREEADLCAYALANLRTEHFEDYRDRRSTEIVAGSLSRELNLLYSVLEHIRRRVGLIENPLSHVRRPKVNDARDTRLSPEEEALLLAALEKSRNEWIKPFVIVALETAMRRSELLALKWENVDLRRQTAHLPDTKNGKGRTVPLSSRAVAVLDALLRSNSGMVFPTSCNSLEHAWVRARGRAAVEAIAALADTPASKLIARLTRGKIVPSYERCVEAAKAEGIDFPAGLTNLHMHDLRHEATSRLAERGWNVLELAAVTGHSDLQMLKRYTNFRAEDLARKMG